MERKGRCLLALRILERSLVYIGHQRPWLIWFVPDIFYIRIIGR